MQTKKKERKERKEAWYECIYNWTILVRCCYGPVDVT